MIGVIADDFTGAAEIGGLGLRYGLKVAIRTAVASAPEADLLVIATDTRSKDAGTAVEDMREVTSGLRDLNPRILYKKLDSVLRGHIIPELAAQMEILGMPRSLIVPANPAFERTINNGIYYVKGKKLHETGFGLDPEFAISSSYVPEILKSSETDRLFVARPEDSLPQSGFVVGEAGTTGDLRKWAGRIDEATLAAGSSGFFAAVLDRMGFRSRRPVRRNEVDWGNKKLFVCGSSFAASKKMIRGLAEQGRPVCLLPAALSEPGPVPPDLLERCASEITAQLSRHDYAVVSVDAVGENSMHEAARCIREHMAGVVSRVMQHAAVDELLLEGGATASAVLNKLGLKTFYPEQEVGRGVIRMRIPDKPELHVTMKPGSYRWPPGIRALLK